MRAFASLALLIFSISAADVRRPVRMVSSHLTDTQRSYLSSYNVRIPYGNAVLPNWIPSKPIVVRRVQASAKNVFRNYDSVTQTYSPCGPPTPYLLLNNGSTSVAYSLPNLLVPTKGRAANELTGNSDSGIVSVPFAAGAPIHMKIIYNRTTCNTVASEFNINVQYTGIARIGAF